jgi:curli biogenesis system outer membrane secretion channel CsgG
MNFLSVKMCTTVVLSALLTGCAGTKQFTASPVQKNVLQGPVVTRNATPLEDAFVCMRNTIKDQGKAGLSISVGNIKDYTGKFSEGDGGNPITQGGALMVTSALGKLSGAIQMRERFDTQITEIELAYLNKQYLGDGKLHRISDANTNKIKNVKWMPYTGGTILKSDYYIVGGITELNYNIQTGGAELYVTGVGAMHRVFVLNVAVDLRIVNTETLNVEKVVSLQKQLLGYEVGTNIFRFWGNRLVDFNTGRKRQEPLQMGVRTALEMGVLELVSHVTKVPVDACTDDYNKHGGSKKSRSVSKTYEVGDSIAEQPATSSKETVAMEQPQTKAVTEADADLGPDSDPLLAPLFPSKQAAEAIGVDRKNRNSLADDVSRIISQSESYEAEQPLSKMMSETETYGPEEVPLASAKQLASK